MSNLYNLYYDAEKFGLTPITEVTLRQLDYSFDILMVWYHQESNTIYWATDSGCSCPLPFENYTSLNDAYILEDINSVRSLIRDSRENPLTKDMHISKILAIIDKRDQQNINNQVTNNDNFRDIDWD